MNSFMVACNRVVEQKGFKINPKAHATPQYFVRKRASNRKQEDVWHFLLSKRKAFLARLMGPGNC